MDDTRILMVVTEEEAKAAYEKALRELNVSYDVAGSFHEVLGMTIERAYSGLLIDILTLVRSSKEEKTIAYECINYYPSLRVKWDARTKRMNLSPLEQSFSADAGATLGFFIQQRCRAFAARPLRRHNRRETVLSLLLSTSADFTAGETVKSFTVNISRGGGLRPHGRALRPGGDGLAAFQRIAGTGGAQRGGLLAYRVGRLQQHPRRRRHVRRAQRRAGKGARPRGGPVSESASPPPRGGGGDADLQF